MSMHARAREEATKIQDYKGTEDVSFKRGEEEKREGKGPSKYVTSFP